MRSKFLYKTTALILSAALSAPIAFSSFTTAFAADDMGISYEFSGNAAGKAGYAEGTITFKAASGGTYKLYWADDSKALDGYYPIGKLSLKSGEKGTAKLGYHTVIPAKATKIIATTSSRNVSDAEFVYDIPANKQLSSVSGDLLYTFSTYSDLHIDERERPLYWVNAQSNLSKALNISAEKGISDNIYGNL